MLVEKRDGDADEREKEGGLGVGGRSDVDRNCARRWWSSS